jgi:hypothetical protein
MILQNKGLITETLENELHSAYPDAHVYYMRFIK